MNKWEKFFGWLSIILALVLFTLLTNHEYRRSSEIIFYRPLYVYDLVMLTISFCTVYPVMFLLKKGFSAPVGLPDKAKIYYETSILKTKKVSINLISLGLVFLYLSFQFSRRVMFEDFAKLDVQAGDSKEVNAELLILLRRQFDFFLINTADHTPKGLLIFGVLSAFSVSLGLYFWFHAKKLQKSFELNQHLFDR